LGLCHALDYYTGVIFEGHLPGVGAPVLTGGRYDALLTEWGAPGAATGFALELDRVLEALERQGRLPELPGLSVVLACEPGQEVLAMQEATRLRAQGLTVEIDLGGRSGGELEAYAKVRGANRVVIPGEHEGSSTAKESEGGRRPERPQTESIH
jgi:ATP phosphoribosyltransferase regulatory subunit